MVSRPASAKWPKALLATALLASCYDTPVIEAPRLADNGASAGESAAGEPNDSAGFENGGSNAGASSGGTKSSAGQSSSLGGQGGHATSPRVTWLTLSGDEAPATQGANPELHVQGAFYAYSDGCAEVTWDRETRCVSGRLCNPSTEPDAWGMAIGFDFRNTGPNGIPPNTKQLWDPRDVGALGVAWRIRARSPDVPVRAPALQLWVLNMAKSWQGMCDVMSCEISGPPDGVDVAALDGELLFSQMVKDDWNGSGEAYDFDPAAVHALQFKLPAVRARAATFDFCLDALGIIR